MWLLWCKRLWFSHLENEPGLISPPGSNIWRVSNHIGESESVDESESCIENGNISESDGLTSAPPNSGSSLTSATYGDLMCWEGRRRILP